MFFIIGISQGQKQLSFVQSMICRVCGQYGRYEAFMTYTYLSLFFIPIVKWGKRYFVKSSCCNTVYELNPEKGKRIAKGVDEAISESDLTPVYGWNSGQYYAKRCRFCGYEADADFDFCPKCGNRL